MPDLSMCQNSKCKSAKSCYRSTAKPTEPSQSYSVFNTDNKYTCDFFISNGSGGKKQ